MHPRIVTKKGSARAEEKRLLGQVGRTLTRNDFWASVGRAARVLTRNYFLAKVGRALPRSDFWAKVGCALTRTYWPGKP